MSMAPTSNEPWEGQQKWDKFERWLFSHFLSFRTLLLHSEMWTIFDYLWHPRDRSVQSVLKVPMTKTNVLVCWVIPIKFFVALDCKTVGTYFCVFKYARAVKQKVWIEAENGERDCLARVRLLKTYSLENKVDCFAVYYRFKLYLFIH